MSTLHVKICIGGPDTSPLQTLAKAVSMMMGEERMGDPPNAVAFKEALPDGDVITRVGMLYETRHRGRQYFLDLRNPGEFCERETNAIYVIEDSLMFLHHSFAVVPRENAAQADKITAKAMNAVSAV